MLEDEIREMLIQAAAYRVPGCAGARAASAASGPRDGRSVRRCAFLSSMPTRWKRASCPPFTRGQSRRCADAATTSTISTSTRSVSIPFSRPSRCGPMSTRERTRREVEAYVERLRGRRRAGPGLPGLVRRAAGHHAGLFPARVPARASRPSSTGTASFTPISGTSSAWRRSAPMARVAPTSRRNTILRAGSCATTSAR